MIDYNNLLHYCEDCRKENDWNETLKWNGTCDICGKKGEIYFFNRNKILQNLEKKTHYKEKYSVELENYGLNTETSITKLEDGRYNCILLIFEENKNDILNFTVTTRESKEAAKKLSYLKAKKEILTN